MTTSLEHARTADRRARAFLANQPEPIVVSLEQLPPRGYWRCELSIPAHPGGEDMGLQVVGRGRTRGYALDVAHAELRGEVVRYYLDELAGRADLNARRELEAYEPGILGARRVAAALEHRGAQVTLEQAMSAGLHVKVMSGGKVTVGDVVAYLLSGTPDQQMLAV